LILGSISITEEAMENQAYIKQVLLLVVLAGIGQWMKKMFEA